MNVGIRPLLLLANLVLVLFLSTNAVGGQTTIFLDEALRQAGPDEYLPVIIRLSQQVDKNRFKRQNRMLRKALRRSLLIRQLRQTADTAQAGLLPLIRSGRGRQIRSLWIINGVAARMPAALVEQIARHPAVDRVELDRIVPLEAGSPPVTAPAEWNLNAIKAPDLWNLGYYGQGAVVALVDTGADIDHPDIAASFRGGSNSWFDPNGEYNTPHDNNGHGTGVLSVLVGADAGGTSVGVAPGAQWIAVKIFNSLDEASYSAIHAGFQWLLDPDGNPDTNDAPDIVNNSWGLDQTAGSCNMEFSDDIATLKAADIAVVFSAGNSGPGVSTSVSPADDPQALAAGSVDMDLVVDGSSARGPSACDGSFFPDLAAPGVGILVADLTFGGLFPDSYRVVSGTSFAAAHLSGAMAVLLGAYPNLTPPELEAALRDTAFDLGLPGSDDDYGYGLVDVQAAFNQIGAVYTCTDTDGDGFFLEPACGAPADCNDNGPNIYPGAPEIVQDGVDQDCNGYDLALDIWKSVYYANLDRVSVRVSSPLGDAANLTVDIPGIGVKPMDWNANKQWWQRTTNEATGKGFDPGQPGSVTVAGIEGTLTAPIAVEGCIDQDGDGFFAGPGCGTEPDCRDDDLNIYPGAMEVKHDGIDQDCNGHDLTLDIWKSVYYAARDRVSIRVSSDLGANADLSVDIPGIGPKPMDWNANKQWWQRTTNNATEKGFDPNQPGNVIVTGIEGSDTSAIALE